MYRCYDDMCPTCEDAADRRSPTSLAATGLHALGGARDLRDAQYAAALLLPAGRPSFLHHHRS
jgi:hypothetical protein